eukprot:234405-Chlamydomonas_euryale.AAC.3
MDEPLLSLDTVKWRSQESDSATPNLTFLRARPKTRACTAFYPDSPGRDSLPKPHTLPRLLLLALWGQVGEDDETSLPGFPETKMKGSHLKVRQQPSPSRPTTAPGTCP